MIKGARSNSIDTGTHGAGRATSRQAYTVEACDVGTPITLGNERALHHKAARRWRGLKPGDRDQLRSRPRFNR